jgi:hypothetical protein
MVQLVTVFDVWVAFEVGESVVDFALLEGTGDVFAGIRSWCHCGSSQYRKRFYSLLDVSTRCNQPLGANRVLQSRALANTNHQAMKLRHRLME